MLSPSGTCAGLSEKGHQHAAGIIALLVATFRGSDHMLAGGYGEATLAQQALFGDNTGDQDSWDQFVSQAVRHQARCTFNAAQAKR
jgi:hypothetical protein